MNLSNKKDSVYKSLRRQITSGTIIPGTRLIEMDLAAKFDVSRTIIREAIKQLAMEELPRTEASPLR